MIKQQHYSLVPKEEFLIPKFLRECNAACSEFLTHLQDEQSMSQSRKYQQYQYLQVKK